jgi:quercetin dioxygenase-like cupin family protein
MALYKKDETPSQIEKLRALTASLPTLQDLSTRDNGDVVEMRSDEPGTLIFGRGCYHADEVNVARWYMSAGASIERHVHDAREWLLVYEGCMEITLNGNVHKIEAGQGIEIPPNITHKARWPRGTRLISVTIPSVEGMPDAGCTD